MAMVNVRCVNVGVGPISYNSESMQYNVDDEDTPSLHVDSKCLWLVRIQTPFGHESVSL